MKNISMRQFRSHTKLIATLGPSSSSYEVLRKMFMEGIDVCRLNFSHGTRSEHLRTITLIRKLNAELGVNVAVLADLQGPKLRIGDIENEPVTLEEGTEFSLLCSECRGTERAACLNYPSLPEDVKPGDRILIDDGKILLEVTSTDGEEIVTTTVIHGGQLYSRKGINLPDTSISLPSLTEKDVNDVLFALEQKVDWIALSFVRSAGDMLELRKLIDDSNGNAWIVAKIEKPEALKEIDGIIDISDAVMVARGDLGVEVEFHQVPMLQKLIVEKCIETATPVIIATQMMESMIRSFRPSRSEATDVANAVLDGADSLMLSGETSVGRHPALVIRSMQKIIDWTEENGDLYFRESPPSRESAFYLPDSICYSAVAMAQQTGARAIITYTHSGYTAVRISSHRPKASIFAFTMNRNLLPMLSLVWGVQAFFLESSGHIEEYVNRSMDLLKNDGLVDPGDVLVHVGSIPLLEHGKTNILKVSYV